MKLIKTLLIALIVSFGFDASAQTYSGTISGTVTNQPPGGGVPIVVQLRTPSIIHIRDTVYTDPAGNYSYPYSFTITGSYGYSRVIMVDCQNYWRNDSLILDTTFATQNPTYSFNYCNTTCNAGFVDSLRSGSSFQFMNTSTPNHGYMNYSWNFGDGNFSNAQNPFHTYNMPGTYNVCLNVYDSLTNCNSSFCDTVNITQCVAGFTTSMVGLQGSFTNTSTTGTGTSYLWDFGDGTTWSTSLNPVHRYNAVGTYTVCLSILDSNSVLNPICDSICQTVTATIPPNGLRLGGNVTGTSVDFGVVYLIIADSNNFLTAIDSVLIGGSLGSNYEFQVFPGSYYLKAALLPPDSAYSSFLPTYNSNTPNTVNWSNATAVMINTANSLNNHINLTQGVNPGGPAFIGGLVSLGANKVAGPGDPYKGAVVILTNEIGDAVAYDVTDEDGKYKIDNLAYGTYKLSIDMLNKPSVEYTIVLSADNEEVENINFLINSTEISTGINQLSNVSLNGLYPNPASDNVYLTIEAKNSSIAQMVVVDMLGKEVMNSQLNLAPGKQVISLNVSNIQEGIYFVNIVSGDEVKTQKFVKQ